MEQEVTLNKETQRTLDLLRVALFVRIASTHLDMNREDLPEDINKGVVHELVKSFSAFSAEVTRVTKGKVAASFFTRQLKPEKLLDMSNLLELMTRIGSEEHPDRYEEYLGLVVDTLDKLLYAQTNRRTLYFPKYRALLKLFIDELRAEVNKEKGQVLFHNGELYLTTRPPQTSVSL